MMRPPISETLPSTPPLRAILRLVPRMSSSRTAPKVPTLSFANEKAYVPAEKVKKVVDTTSAGDSFNGAFLAHYLENRDAPAAARFGAKIAARVVSEHGALVPKEKLGL